MSAARRTIVKVCGITRLTDAAIALEAGADWLGFIVNAGGPRQIGAEGMAIILRSLPGAVGVAVLARVTPEESLQLAREAGATRLQLHHCDSSLWPADFPVPCAFVTGIDGEGVVHAPLAPTPHLVHLDTAHPALTGGTGMSFPWTRAREIVGERHFVLAGGLDGSNVARAIDAARPYAVDAASKLEASVGIKDPDKVRRFVAAVRESDER
jgi:phosphoribosylanthranilate isomerase